MTEVEIEFEKAEKGREIIDACLPNNDKNNVVVVFPDDNKELLNTAFKYFDRFLSDYDYAVVVTSIEVEELANYTDRPFNIVEISDGDMQCVLRYVSMSGLAAIKVISLRKPHCQKAEILNGFKDITLDKIVCRDLYEIWGII